MQAGSVFSENKCHGVRHFSNISLHVLEHIHVFIRILILPHVVLTAHGASTATAKANVLCEAKKAVMTQSGTYPRRTVAVADGKPFKPTEARVTHPC